MFSAQLMIAWWSLIILVALVAELVTTALVAIWFVAGAVVALIAVVLGATPMVQFILFFVVTLITSLLALVLMKDKRKNGKPTLENNVDRYIGKIANVTERIDNITGSGRAVYGGVSWAARSSDDSVKIDGGQVRILKVEGSKLIVEPLK